MSYKTSLNTIISALESILEKMKTAGKIAAYFEGERIKALEYPRARYILVQNIIEYRTASATNLLHRTTFDFLFESAKEEDLPTVRDLGSDFINEILNDPTLGGKAKASYVLIHECIQARLETEILNQSRVRIEVVWE